MNFCLARANTVLLCVYKCMITPDIQCPIYCTLVGHNMREKEVQKWRKQGRRGGGVGGRKRETERQTERGGGGEGYTCICMLTIRIDYNIGYMSQL